MPLLPTQEDEEQGQGGATGGSQTLPQTGGGTSGVAGTGGMAGGQTTGTGGQTAKGTGFVNVDRYTKANQDRNFGNQVSTKIDGQGQEVQSNLTGLQTGFNDAVNQGSTVRNNNVLKNISSGKAAKVVGDKNQLQSYRDMTNASYSGPRELSQQEGYLDFLQKYNQNQQNLQNTASDDGRYALLTDLYNRPTYSGGEKRLDQAILQTDPNARQGFADLRDKYAGMQGQVDNATTTAQSLAQQRAAEMVALRREAADSVKNRRSAFESELNTGLEQANTSRRAAHDRTFQDKMNEALRGFISSKDQRKDIKESLAKVYQYGGDLNRSQTISPEQAAQYNALAQLMGTNEVIAPSKATKATKQVGKYSPKVYKGTGTLSGKDPEGYGIPTDNRSSGGSDNVVQKTIKRWVGGGK